VEEAENSIDDLAKFKSLLCRIKGHAEDLAKGKLLGYPFNTDCRPYCDVEVIRSIKCERAPPKIGLTKVEYCG
jgi:hypothetical protein